MTIKMAGQSGLMVLAALSLCAVLASCKVVDDATGVNKADVGQSLQQTQNKLTRKELAQKLRRLAMSYLGEVPEACELIAAANPSLEQRLLALRIRVDSTDSVISIAADPDPQVSLLNMVTVLTLQRMLAEERAEELFGDQAGLYINATRRMEDEAWKLAGQVMKQDEQRQLRELIAKYRNDHPSELYVWWVRFSEFSAYKEDFSIASIGQGFVDVFVPVGSAVSGIESTTDVAERATWLAARQAMIIQWRVELTYLQTLSAPETSRLLEDIEKVSETIDKLPERVAQERKAILAAIEDQQEGVGKLIAQTQDAVKEARSGVQDTRGAIKDAGDVVKQVDESVVNAEKALVSVQDTLKQADESIAKAKAVLPETEKSLAQLDTTAKTLTQTIQTLDGFLKQFESEDDSESRPFDITEYTQAVNEAGKTVQELNTLVAQLDQTAQPDRLGNTLDVMQGRASALIWQGGFVLLGAGLILILALKLIPRRASA